MFRIRGTQVLSNGLMKEIVSLSKIKKNSLKKYYPSILNIASSLLLLDNSICMIFTKFVRKNKYQFLNTDISKREELIYFIK